MMTPHEEIRILSDASASLHRIEELQRDFEEGHISEEVWERTLSWVRSRHAGVIQMLSQGTTLLTVRLNEVGQKKIQVIKEILSVNEPTLGLAEAKDLVESAPVTVLATTSRSRAEDAASKLRGAGAEVEVVT